MKRKIVVVAIMIFAMAMAMLCFAACEPVVGTKSNVNPEASHSVSASRDSHTASAGSSGTQSGTQSGAQSGNQSGNQSGQTDTVVTLTIDWNYEGAPANTKLTYKNGLTVDHAEYPVRDDYEIVGFSFDKAGTLPVSLDYLPQEDTTVYACWALKKTYYLLGTYENFENAWTVTEESLKFNGMGGLVLLNKDNVVKVYNGTDNEWVAWAQSELYDFDKDGNAVIKEDGWYALSVSQDKAYLAETNISFKITVKWNYEGAGEDLIIDEKTFNLNAVFDNIPEREGFEMVGLAFDAEGKQPIEDDFAFYYNDSNEYTVFVIWAEKQPEYEVKDGFYLLGTYGEYEGQWTPSEDDQLLGASDEYAAYLKVKLFKDNKIKVWKGTWIEWAASDCFAYDNDKNAIIKEDGEYEIYVKDGAAYMTKVGGSEPPVTEPAAVTLKFVEAYGEHYFHFTATSEYAIENAAYVKVNGVQAWSEPTKQGDGTYAFKVYVGDITLNKYVFEWYDATGKVAATATYTQQGSETYTIDENAYYLLGTYGAYTEQWAPSADEQKLGASDEYAAYLKVKLFKDSKIKVWKGTWIEWTASDCFAYDNDKNAIVGADGEYEIYVKDGAAYMTKVGGSEPPAPVETFTFSEVNKYAPEYAELAAHTNSADLTKATKLVVNGEVAEWKNIFVFGAAGNGDYHIQLHFAKGYPDSYVVEFYNAENQKFAVGYYKEAGPVTVTITVKWNYDGAPEDTKITVVDGVYTLPEVPERNGYTFVWYAFDKDGKDMVPTGDEGPREDVTVYAIWKENYVADENAYYLLGSYSANDHSYNDTWAPADDSQKMTAKENCLAAMEGVYFAKDAETKVRMGANGEWINFTATENYFATTANGNGKALVEGLYNVYVVEKTEGERTYKYAYAEKLVFNFGVPAYDYFKAYATGTAPDGALARVTEMYSQMKLYLTETAFYLAKGDQAYYGTYTTGENASLTPAGWMDVTGKVTPYPETYTPQPAPAVFGDKYVDMIVDGGERYSIWIRFAAADYEETITVTVKWNYEGAPEDSTLIFVNGVQTEASQYEVPDRSGNYTLEGFMTAAGAIVSANDLSSLPADATVYAMWKEVYHYNANAYYLLGTYGNYKDAWEPSDNGQMLGAMADYDAFLYIDFNAGDTVKLWKDGTFIEWQAGLFNFDKNGNAVVKFTGNYQVYVLEGKAYLIPLFVNGDEENLLPDVWTYWYVQSADWNCGAPVTMTKAEKNANGAITLTYEGGSNDWCVQLFYRNSALDTSKSYTLTCTVNASAKTSVKINGKVFDLKAGDNEIEVTFAAGTAGMSSFDAQFNMCKQETTVSLYGFNWAEYQAPDNEMPYGEEKTALKNAGTYYYWARDWSAPVDVSEHTYENGAITITYTGAGENWWDVQLFFDDANLAAGKSYKLSMTINAYAACDITVKGQVVKLARGDNRVSVIFTEDKNFAAFSVQFGVSKGNVAVTEGTFTFSNITIAPTFTGDAKKYYLIGKFGENEVWYDVNAAYAFGAGDENNTAVLDNAKFAAGDTFKAVTGDGNVWYNWNTENEGNAALLSFDKDGNGIVKESGVYNVYLSKDGMLYIAKAQTEPTQPKVVTVTVKWGIEGVADTTVVFTNGVASEYTIPTYEGHALKAWRIYMGDGSYIEVSLDTVPEEDVTVHAVWEDTTTFKPEAGSYYLLGWYGAHAGQDDVWAPGYADQKMGTMEGFAAFGVYAFKANDQLKMWYQMTAEDWQWIAWEKDDCFDFANDFGDAKIKADGRYFVYVYGDKAYITASMPTLVTLTVNYNYGERPIVKTYTFFNGKVNDFETPTRDGYTFKGFSTDAAGNNMVEMNAPEQNVTVYAQWEENSQPQVSGVIELDIGGASKWFFNDDAVAYIHVWYTDGTTATAAMTEEGGKFYYATDTEKTLAGLVFYRTDPAKKPGEEGFIWNQSVDVTDFTNGYSFCFTGEETNGKLVVATFNNGNGGNGGNAGGEGQV